MPNSYVVCTNEGSSFSSDSHVLCTNEDSSSSNDQATPSNDQDTTFNDEGTSSNNQATPSNNQATSSNNQATSSNEKVASISSNEEILRSKGEQIEKLQESRKSLYYDIRNHQDIIGLTDKADKLDGLLPDIAKEQNSYLKQLKVNLHSFFDGDSRNNTIQENLNNIRVYARGEQKASAEELKKVEEEQKSLLDEYTKLSKRSFEDFEDEDETNEESLQDTEDNPKQSSQDVEGNSKRFRHDNESGKNPPSSSSGPSTPCSGPSSSGPSTPCSGSSSSAFSSNVEKDVNLENSFKSNFTLKFLNIIIIILNAISEDDNYID